MIHFVSQLIGPVTRKLLASAEAPTAFLASVSFCRHERIEAPPEEAVPLCLSATCAEQQTPDEFVSAAAAVLAALDPAAGGAAPALFAGDVEDALPAGALLCDWADELVEPAGSVSTALSICEAALPDWPGEGSDLCPATGSQ